MQTKKHPKRQALAAVEPLVPGPVKTLEELAAEQGVKPIEDVDAFLKSAKGIWPENESIDDFLAWLREMRRVGGPR